MLSNHSTMIEPLSSIDAGRRELARYLLSHVPPDGSPIGNISLRRFTRTVQNTHYRAAMRLLVDVGVLKLGKGLGGSVCLSPTCVEALQGYTADTSARRPVGYEQWLYPSIKSKLEADLKSQAENVKSFVHVTALQGATSTGGHWSRPDLTAVKAETYAGFRFLPKSFFDVSTYEVKTISALAKNPLMALGEAHAHRRAVHYSTLLVKLEEPSDRVRIGERVIAEAKRSGVGITAVLAVDEPWDVVVPPEINFPFPSLSRSSSATS